MFEQGAHEGLAITRTPVDPEEHCLKDELLAGHLNMVPGQQFSEAALWQIEELFVVDDISKVLVNITSRYRFKFGAGVDISKGMDPCEE